MEKRIRILNNRQKALYTFILKFNKYLGLLIKVI